jgi:hypothetical protein
LTSAQLKLSSVRFMQHDFLVVVRVIYYDALPNPDPAWNGTQNIG